MIDVTRSGRMTLLQVVGILVLVLGSAPASAQQPVAFDGALAEEFRALLTRMTDAIKAHDRRLLEEFVTSDYALTIAELGSPLIHISRADWLEAAATTYKIASYEFKEIVVRRYGDLAVVASYYTQNATADGADRSGDFLLTDIWVRIDGRWRIAWRHSSEPETR